MKINVAEVRKAAVVVVTGLAGIVATGQLDGYTSVLAVVNDVIAVAAALGVYAVPNRSPHA